MQNGKKDISDLSFDILAAKELAQLLLLESLCKRESAIVPQMI